MICGEQEPSNLATFNDNPSNSYGHISQKNVKRARG